MGRRPRTHGGHTRRRHRSVGQGEQLRPIMSVTHPVQDRKHKRVRVCGHPKGIDAQIPGRFDQADNIKLIERLGSRLVGWACPLRWRPDLICARGRTISFNINQPTPRNPNHAMDQFANDTAGPPINQRFSILCSYSFYVGRVGPRFDTFPFPSFSSFECARKGLEGKPTGGAPAPPLPPSLKSPAIPCTFDLLKNSIPQADV